MFSRSPTHVFRGSGRHRRRLLVACGACLALGVAAFPFEWPPALAGGLIGMAVGLAAAADKEAAREPELELSAQALSYRGAIIARWRDIDHVDCALRTERGGRAFLTLREFARGEARPEVHRLDISELSEEQRSEVLQLARARAQEALEEAMLLGRHSPAGMLRGHALSTSQHPSSPR